MNSMRQIEFKTRINPSMSKNKKFVSRYFVLSKEFRKAKWSLIEQIKSELKKNCVKFEDKKRLKITAFFTRSNLRIDIQNFQEAICDSVQEACKVNDRYFYFGEWDWVLDRKSVGEIKIKIEQEDGT